MAKKNKEITASENISQNNSIDDDFKEKLLGDVSKILVQISKTREDIESAVTPKFIDVSPQLKDLIELAVEIWRLENRINRNMDIQESQKEILRNSIQKIKRYLEKNDLEVLDYTDKKFNDGRNLEILAVEKDPTVKDPIIKETKEPTIMCKGQVVRKGKVIILTSENKPATGVQNE